ncbi:hypothetical protein BC939DRAFT_462658 [Gamsiella multidivaricata]|uniref:uncharacterized protein n=1 Tax=Gamsiella multidivaricata TaxID=101098 RepID=UPI002220EE98|nr:uncharacterized protein BC939DRAFT_462658 [Gamsiella multidivaricata]KAI7818491.1 hypothetical protein BC939DRAFT_462658 [Gamsiella multidivaricata]
MAPSHLSLRGGPSSTEVLPQMPFPAHTALDRHVSPSSSSSSPSPKRSPRHSDTSTDPFISSRNDFQPISSQQPSTSTNSKLDPSVSFAAPSPPRSPSSKQSSSLSSQSLASLTPSMSPSSIISLQRSARQEKRHIRVPVNDHHHQKNHKQSSPSTGAYMVKGSSVNRSAMLQNSSAAQFDEKEKEKEKEKAAKLNRGTNSSSKMSTKGNRFSSWASSIRQTLSPSSKKAAVAKSKEVSSAPTPSASKTPISPVSPQESPSPVKNEKSSTKPQDHTPRSNANVNVNAKAKANAGTTKTTEATVLKSANISHSSTTTSSGSTPSQQPRIRILLQGRSKKIGSGLITVFCIVAVVILIVLC